MSFPISDTLAVIQSALFLLKEEPSILASPEDAAYFRTRQLYHNRGTEKTNLAPPPHPPTPPPPKPPLPKIETPIEELPPEGRSGKELAANKISSSIDLVLKDRDCIELPVQPVPAKVEKHLSTPPKMEISQPQPSPPSARPSSQFRSILEKIAPELAILDAIPDDTTAKQIANRWKTKNQSAPISILSCGELPQHKALLVEIATALDVYFGPARFIEAEPIEKEKQWKTFLSVGSLKMIVICDSTLWQLHHLRQFYKETPATGIRMLGDVPILLLPDLSLYLKDPPLKRSLWKALCSKLS